MRARSSWYEYFRKLAYTVAEQMFQEAGVVVVYLDDPSDST